MDQPDDRQDDPERERALAILQAAHEFPVIYEISVIALTTPEITAALRDTIESCSGGTLGDGDHHTVPSRAGKYTSHRFRVPCAQAEDVLVLIARVRALPGVKTTL
jgi:putative lipoic acid-binding regulatory protein